MLYVLAFMRKYLRSSCTKLSVISTQEDKHYWEKSCPHAD